MVREGAVHEHEMNEKIESLLRSYQRKFGLARIKLSFKEVFKMNDTPAVRFLNESFSS